MPHRRLLLKLKHYGITGKTNKWIEAWLCHRQQSVVLIEATSTDSHVLSRVPQDTMTTIKMFTDDPLLYRTINDPSDEIQMQHLDTKLEWSKAWLTCFNAKKCHLLKVSRKRKTLQAHYSIDCNSLEEVSIIFT